MSFFIEGDTGKWEVVLGLEVHAQIKSNSKLFSTASTEWGGDPNTQVELVDCGCRSITCYNEFCVDQAILTGLSINAQINEKSIFDERIIFIQIYPKVIKFHNLNFQL